MEREKRQAPGEEGQGAPLWMVTFSDCMNLLLTFFVLLVTFSSFDSEVLMDIGIVFRRLFPVFAATGKDMPKDAFSSTTLVTSVDAHEYGSEKPTLARGLEDNLKQQTVTGDFRTRKVFWVDSKNIFWGRGGIISTKGQNTLGLVALFLEQSPGHVIISEHSLNNQADDKTGIRRAWSVLEYLTTTSGLDKKRFNISTAINLADVKDEEKRNSGSRRILEIVLLERRAHN